MGERNWEKQVDIHNKILLPNFCLLRNQPDPQAQIGFLSGEGQSFLLPVSGLDQIQNIDKWSNTDVPGLWIFKVGPLAPLENIIEPEPSDFQGNFDPIQCITSHNLSLQL